MGKKAELLSDPDITRWHANVKRGSPITADVNLRRLSRFCEQHGLTPKDLVALGNKNRKELEDLIQDHITKMEAEGKSPGYIEGILKGVKSWLVHNEIELKRKIQISNRGATPTIEEERVPEKSELKTIFMYGDERARAAACLVAQSGLRPQVLGNELGNDGLTIGDLPELKIYEDHVEFTKIPTMVMVRAPISKAGHKYFTFLPSEGCEYLSAYLNKRLSSGETFNEKTPVIAAKPGYEERGWNSQRNMESQFMTTRNVSRIIREAMRPRFKWRPYVLRAYFDTQMLLAESHGKITHPYRVFFMGHKGDIEARYTTNKGRLPNDLIEDMRKSFEKCEEYLSATPKSAVVDLEKIKIESVLAVAQAQGLPKEKVDSIRKVLSESENPTLDEAIQLLSGSADLSSSFTIRKPADEKNGTMPSLNNNGKPFQSKIIVEKELVSYTEDGWEIVRELSNRKFLIKKPNHVTTS